MGTAATLEEALASDWYRPNTNEGKCHCGCGKSTALAPRTIRRDGHLKGSALRYVHGHNAGYLKAVQPTDCDDVNAYMALHHWVRANWPKSGTCDHCGAVAGDRPHDWASIDHLYSRSREDWLELCRPCHRRLDNGLRPNAA